MKINESILKIRFLSDVLSDQGPMFLLIVFVISLLYCREKLEHSRYLGAKDTKISLKIGDLLEIKDSAIVIPTNTTFDTTMEDCFISEESIQGQFQKKFYGADFSDLNYAIKDSLRESDDCCPIELKDRDKTNKTQYEIGTVAKITIHGQHYYFLAVADVDKAGKPQHVTMENMTKALVRLWDYLSRKAYTEPIAIPVIGTGRAGLIDGGFEEIVRETIFSFISESQGKFVAKKMTICIYPPKLSEVNAKWEKLCLYLDSQCLVFEENENRRKTSNAVGTVVE